MSLTSVTMDVIPSDMSKANLSLMSPGKEEQALMGGFDGRFRIASAKFDLWFRDPSDDRSYISHDSYFEVKFELKSKTSSLHWHIVKC